MQGGFCHVFISFLERAFATKIGRFWINALSIKTI